MTIVDLDASPAVEFALERLSTADGQLVLEGRWYGVTGRRFMRPVLRVDGRRRLATLEHKPWAADEGEPWIAAFPHDGEPVGTAQLEVGPGVIVEIEPPDAQRRRPPRQEREARAAQSRAEHQREAARAARDQAVRERDEARRTADQLARERDALAEERDAARRESEERRVAREGARAEIERARRERDAAAERAQRAEHAAEEARVEMHGLRQELGELRRVQPQAEKLAAQAATLEEERDAARAQVERLRRELKTARAEAERAASSVRERPAAPTLVATDSREIERLRKELAEARAEADGLQQEMAATRAVQLTEAMEPPRPVARRIRARRRADVALPPDPARGNGARIAALVLTAPVVVALLTVIVRILF